MRLLRWFKRLFHFHEWETIYEREIVNPREHEIGKFYIQKCTVCSEIRKRTMTLGG